MIVWGLTALSAQNMLYHAFEKYVAVKKVKLIRTFEKVSNLMCWEYIQ